MSQGRWFSGAQLSKGQKMVCKDVVYDGRRHFWKCVISSGERWGTLKSDIPLSNANILHGNMRVLSSGFGAKLLTPASQPETHSLTLSPRHSLSLSLYFFLPSFLSFYLSIYLSFYLSSLALPLFFPLSLFPSFPLSLFFSLSLSLSFFPSVSLALSHSRSHTPFPSPSLSILLSLSLSPLLSSVR